jgi:hypothetical protein
VPHADRSAAAQGPLQRLEIWLFRRRLAVLGALALLTVVMGWFASQLRMDAGFEKQLPIGHEYVRTFNDYRNDLLGANRLTVVVKARKGNIWSAPALQRLYDVTQAVTFLPYVERASVQSLWTPNSFVNEITEEGFRADPLVPGDVTPDRLDSSKIDAIARTMNSSARCAPGSRTTPSRSRSSALPSRSATSLTVHLRCWSSAVWRCCLPRWRCTVTAVPGG